MDIESKVNDIFPMLVDIRRDFHMHPELSNQEFRTMGKICEYLDLWGIAYEKGIAGTGVVAIINGSKPGKTIGIRGDIDALKMQEEISMPYKSKTDGISHTCGHDGHTTILLGVAKILKSMENAFAGSVKFFFQPAEETTGGAQRMIESGCMENPHVDYVLGLHMHPKYEVGMIGVKYGKMMAASDEFKVTVHGKTCHGAHPELGIDAVVIASQIIVSLQSIVNRQISPLDSAVCSVGYINGGTTGNVIAGEVEFGGIIRTLDSSARKFLQDKIICIAEHTALAMGGKATVEFRHSYGPLINNDLVTDIVKDNAIEVLGKDNVFVEAFPDMGTEDFSYFAMERPSCFFHLGCGNSEKGINADIHNCKFDMDERCLSIGVQLQIKNILSLLKK